MLSLRKAFSVFVKLRVRKDDAAMKLTPIPNAFRRLSHESDGALHLASLVDFAALPDWLQRGGLACPLIIADESGVSVLERLLSILTQAQLRYVSLPIPAGKTSDDLPELAEEAKAAWFSAGADCVLSVGGPLALDCAKAVSAWLSKPEASLEEAVSHCGHEEPDSPLIACPTLDALENGCFAPLRLSASNGPAVQLFPSQVLLDPCLLRGTDASTRAMRGMQAFADALEVFACGGAGATLEKRAVTVGALLVRSLSAACAPEPEDAALAELYQALFHHQALRTLCGPGLVWAAGSLVAEAEAQPPQAYAAALLPSLLATLEPLCGAKLAKFSAGCQLASGMDADKMNAALSTWVRDAAAGLGLPLSAPSLRRVQIPGLARRVLQNNQLPCAPSAFDVEELLLPLLSPEAPVADVGALVAMQRAFFRTGETLKLDNRRTALRRLRHGIEAEEARIAAALKEDLGKSADESYLCEIGLVLSELSHMEAHLDEYAAPHTVRTPLSQPFTRSATQNTPYGVALIMAPWNYPFLLCMDPLIGAIAAGNCAVLKPSAYAPATSAVVRSLCERCFPREIVAVVEGGRAENQALLEQPFDKIFFTGSQAVGREVLRRAAERLTPVTLELGGKSPVLVDATARVDLAAKRIAFGKLLNAGQTCVAPDYVLVTPDCKNELMDRLKYHFARMAMENPLANPDYPHMVNQKHFDRVMALIDPVRVVFGGEGDRETLKIQPTVLCNVTPEDPVMGEEIFGPVLPILEVADMDEAIRFVNDRPHPLACYLFTEDPALKRRVAAEVSCGGLAINDVVMHLANPNLPFGGVGESGMGSYHGRYSFDCFSHQKAVLDAPTWLDIPVRYAPMDQKKRNLLRRLLR